MVLPGLVCIASQFNTEHEIERKDDKNKMDPRQQQQQQQQQEDFTLIVELGLTQQKLHLDLSTAASLFADRASCECSLDTHPPTEPNSAEFKGFLKLEGCSIVEADITVPFLGRKNGVGTELLKNSPSLALPQLVAARHITKSACARLTAWLDLNGRPALHLEACLYELLELRREIEAARYELLGNNLPLYPNSTSTGIDKTHQHPFYSVLPPNLILEVGIQKGQLCVFVWTIAPIPSASSFGSSMFRNFGGKEKEDVVQRELITAYVDESNVASSGWVVRGTNNVVRQFSSYVCPCEPARQMLQHLNNALRTCDRFLNTLQSM